MRVNQLREQLADLKKKEVVAQTRESFLDEEKKKILNEIDTLYAAVRELSVIPDADLTPNNLSVVVAKLQKHIEDELAKSSIPRELQ